jgi:predicted RNase H-like HicB family nuclease
LGCVAIGGTLEEVEEAMREAIEFHLDGMQQEGLVIPEPTSIGTMLNLSKPA